MKEEFDLWRHVYEISEEISRSASRGEVSSADLRGYLSAIEEVFGPPEDPGGDFRRFAVLHLCRSLRRAMTSGGG